MISDGSPQSHGWRFAIISQLRPREVLLASGLHLSGDTDSFFEVIQLTSPHIEQSIPLNVRT